MASPRAVALRIEHKDPKILLLLQSSFFRVPAFQRSYVWESEQVTDFSRDLWEGFDEGKTWFIGTLIVAKGDPLGRLGEALDIIDGQQRLTTLFMWLASLRDQCKMRGIQDLADYIDSAYLQDKSPLAPAGGQPRLAVGKGETNSYFQAVVIDGRATRNPLHGSEQRLHTASANLGLEIATRLDSAKAPKDLVKDLLEWLRESLHAFIAIAPTVGSASKLYDLMNSRGRPLEASDLLKSYLFYVTDGAATSEWAAIAQRFDPLIQDADSVPQIDTFIRHQWFSRHPIPQSDQRGAPTQRATQDLIRHEAGNKASALNYLGKLRSDAETYLQLARPTQAYWEKQSGKGIFEALQDLNLIKVESFRPLILSVTGSFPYVEQLVFLRSLLSWAFRKKVVTGKLGSGEDERAYFNAAYSVTSRTASSTREILGLLDIPDDSRFEQSFATTNIAARTARWVLGRLEDSLEGSKERRTKWDEMTLEHILPFSDSKLGEWPKFSPEQHRSYRQNIGNLTLLRKNPNEKAGNGPYEKKVKAYAASTLKITSSIAAYPEWTPDTVKNRAEKLAKEAVDVWPLLSPPW